MCDFFEKFETFAIFDTNGSKGIGKSLCRLVHFSKCALNPVLYCFFFLSFFLLLDNRLLIASNVFITMLKLFILVDKCTLIRLASSAVSLGRGLSPGVRKARGCRW